MPAFVYLIPAIVFFGIGVVPGMVATIIFALPPGVRLTELTESQASYLGVPVAEWGFGGAGGVYHSQYDSFDWMRRFGDPGFRYHAAAARVLSARGRVQGDEPRRQVPADVWAEGSVLPDAGEGAEEDGQGQDAEGDGEEPPHLGRGRPRPPPDGHEDERGGEGHGHRVPDHVVGHFSSPSGQSGAGGPFPESMWKRRTLT